MESGGFMDEGFGESASDLLPMGSIDSPGASPVAMLRHICRDVERIRLLTPQYKLDPVLDPVGDFPLV